MLYINKNKTMLMQVPTNLPNVFCPRVKTYTQNPKNIPVAVFEEDQYCHTGAMILCLLCRDQQHSVLEVSLVGLWVDFWMETTAAWWTSLVREKNNWKGNVNVVWLSEDFSWGVESLFYKKKSEGKNDSVISSSRAYCYLQLLENKMIRAESASYFFSFV